MENERSEGNDVRGQVLHMFPSFARAMRPDSSDGLKSGDGGGTSGGMEARVAKLESDMEYVKRSLDRVDGKLDALITVASANSAALATIVERTADLSSLKTTANSTASKLELLDQRTAKFGDVKDSISAASSKIDVIDERTKHMPSKTFIWVCVAGISAVVGVVARLIPGI